MVKVKTCTTILAQIQSLQRHRDTNTRRLPLSRGDMIVVYRAPAAELGELLARNLTERSRLTTNSIAIAEAGSQVIDMVRFLVLSRGNENVLD